MKKSIKLLLMYLIIALCMVVLAGCSGQTVTSTPTTQVPDVTQVPTLPELPTPTPTEDIASASIPPQLNEVASPKLDDFHMVDSLNGWGTTDNLLLVTYDGGATWFDITPPGVTRLGYLPSVLFIDPLDGWVVIPADNFVDGTLAITKDGGQNWELIPVPFSGGDIEFLDLNNGFIMVGRGAAAGSSAVDIYSTSDGGHNWTAAYQMQPGMGNDVNSL
ncbi:MAG: WD40/YVTN/BNR-like repeat-containing protein, partial [Anaerolineales bacterium]